MMPTTKQGVRELGCKIGNVGMEALARHHYPEDTHGREAGAPDTEGESLKN